MDKVVYITGGTKGIGLGIAKALVEAGCKVAVSGRNEQTAKEAATSIGDESQVIGFASDVRTLADEEKAVAKIKEHFGRLDVAIANAGVGIYANIQELSADDWQKMIDTNLSGVFHTIKAGVNELVNNKGYFITVASLAGTNFFAGGSGYNASKFGVVGFTQAVMLDLRTQGVKTTTIMPGSVSSYFNERVPDAEKDVWKIQPEDLGQIVVDLLKMHPRTLPSKIEVRPLQTADMLK